MCIKLSGSEFLREKEHCWMELSRMKRTKKASVYFEDTLTEFVLLKLSYSLFYITCVGVMYVWMSMTYLFRDLWWQNRVLDPIELELYTSVSFHIYVKLCFTVQTLSPSWSMLQMFHILHVNLPSPRECPENVPHPHQTSPDSGTSSLFRVRCIFSDWTDTQQSSAIYVLGTSY